MFLALVPNGIIPLKLEEAMRVPNLPHSLRGVGWQKGTNQPMGGTMGPDSTPRLRAASSPGETITELLAATFSIHPLLASRAGASIGVRRAFTVEGPVRPLPSGTGVSGVGGLRSGGGSLSLEQRKTWLPAALASQPF